MAKKQSLQILHISDLHVSTDKSFDRSVVLDPLIQRVKLDQKQGLEPELVVVTGDIAFKGIKEEYELAAKFLNKLMKSLELRTDRLFIVPGNHDRDKNKGIKSLHNYTSVQDLNDDMEDKQNMFLQLRGMEAYFSFIDEYFPHMKNLYNHMIPFVNVYTTCGKKIGLVGLNSAWMCRESNLDKGRIAIGEYQVKKAQEALEGTEPVDLTFYIFHHPLSYLWPMDRRIIKPYFNESIILSGHLHEPGGGFYNELNTKLFQFQAGGAYLGTKIDRPGTIISLLIGIWKSLCFISGVMTKTIGAGIQTAELAMTVKLNFPC